VHTSPAGIESHLNNARGRGHVPEAAFTGAAGGAACGDLVRVSVALSPAGADALIADAGFDASGCGATIAAGSATVSLVRGSTLLDAARVGADDIERELGGLTPGKRHAAELAADALHRALGHAARACPPLERSGGRVLVAMSGGVDSAVAALLERERGTDPLAVTLELWSDPHSNGELSCCSAQAVRSARSLAHGLGMPHLSIDLRAEFRAGVVDPWIDGHAQGLTPNPCIRCNGSVRLDAMLELAQRLGAATLATGHYARTSHASVLRMAADERKDQSYVLCALAPSSLARLRFPLGELHKERVRELARDAGLEVARRRDSQDLCFLAGTRRESFLERHGALRRRAGAIVGPAGEQLGEHGGTHLFTTGQRRGLAVTGAAGERLYVLATDARSNTVTAGPRCALLTSELALSALTLRGEACAVDSVRVRAHGRQLRCRLEGKLDSGTHAGARVALAEPAERTAPGQLACLYAGELVVGHGTVAA